MPFQVFRGIAFHQIIHSPVFSVQEYLAGDVFLDSCAAVFHKGKEKYLFQSLAVVQNQAWIRDVRPEKNRIKALLLIALPGIEGKAFLRKAAGFVAADTDAAFLIKKDISICGIQLDMG